MTPLLEMTGEGEYCGLLQAGLAVQATGAAVVDWPLQDSLIPGRWETSPETVATAKAKAMQMN